MVVLRQETVDVRRLQAPHVGDVQVHQVGRDVVVRRIQDLSSTNGKQAGEGGARMSTCNRGTIQFVEGVEDV